MINNIYLDLSQKADRKHYTFIFASADKIIIIIMMYHIHLDLAKRQRGKLYFILVNTKKINIIIIINHIHLDLSQKAERKHYTFTLVTTPRK